MPAPTNGRGYVLATSQHRTVRRAKNAVQKYAVKQSNGKFKWITTLASATVFPSMGQLLQAVGIRARLLRNQPTGDLIVLQVQQSGISVVGTLNG